tara:strand:+ start:19403 stop:19759 length:357 start_codon:yes stop_codon:yes gene_type:complete
MPDYVKAKASALRQISGAGQDVTRVAYTAGTYDPATRKTTPTTANTTRKGVVFDIGAGVQKIRGELINKTDKQVYLDAEGSVEMDDHFIIQGVEFTIVSIGGINPAGTQVFYDLHLRA